MKRLVLAGLVLPALLMIGSGAAQAAPAAVTHLCGMQRNDMDVVFCETFDQPKPGVGRAGDLDPDVWGVSRVGGTVNQGQGNFNTWYPTRIVGCTGTTTVLPPNDVKVCNGQLREALNDNGGVNVVTIYPKQPFDFAGRTGTVSFDVSNDTQGNHGAWPEFWFTDAPVPGPFSHTTPDCFFCSLPRHGFGIRLSTDSWAGNAGMCPNGGDVRRWGASELAVVRDWDLDERAGQIFSCVTQSSGPNGSLNHVEFRISQNQIEMWGSDAGSTTLRLMTRWSNVNLTATRGLIWIEDAHYNATKGDCESTGLPCQSEHTFTWDNVAFDGPFTYRDFSYDALDASEPWAQGAINLGKVSNPNQTASWNVLGMPANPQAAAARVLFNFAEVQGARPNNFIVTVNGHQHPTPWPFGGSSVISQFYWKTLAVTIPVSDLVPGTNVVQLGSETGMVTANVNIVLVDVPGGVPVLPGSNNAYPGAQGGTPTPVTPTATVATATPTQAPGATPTSTAAVAFASSAIAAPASVSPGQTTTITAQVTSGASRQALVDLEIHAPGAGGGVAQRFFDNQTLTAGQPKTFAFDWVVPPGSAPGAYAIKVGVFTPGWGSMLNWNDAAGSLLVSAASATPTNTPVVISTPTSTPTPPTVPGSTELDCTVTYSAPGVIDRIVCD